ncbi:flavin-dependent monooxygenase [Chamberlinius hualienensis]
MDIDSESKTWMTPPVVVIGAGASGLAAIKSCLEENLNVICFERTDYTGGLWRFRKDVKDGVSSVMRSTIINTCKEINSYSDFPPPDDFPNYMHNTELAKYFDLYAEAFDLNRHIFHRYLVDSVVQNEDFSETGLWNVKVTNLESNKRSSIVAAGVMVCSGHHSHPNIPTFDGLSDFKGPVVHTHAYKDQKPFENKRVLVIGIGNSGGDVAVELSRFCPKVYLSTRSGAWIFNRVGTKGMPFDYLLIRRSILGPWSLYPESFITKKIEEKMNERVDLEMYNLKPKHGYFSQHPTVNDAIPNCILSGTVKVKGDIHHFTTDGVVFQGETSVIYPIDAVVLATGYNIVFPFIDKSLVTVDNNFVDLYKYVFPPKVQPPTLAFIGLIQPIGSIIPISELQCRWFISVLTKQSKLPTVKRMETDIKVLRNEMAKRYVPSKRHTIQVDYIQYMDDVGSHFGAKPNLIKLFFTDPKLWFYCYFGANLPYLYRLNGPHSWPKARNVILTADCRVKAALQTNKNQPKIEKKSSGQYIKIAVIIAAIVVANYFEVFTSKRIGLMTIHQ